MIFVDTGAWFAGVVNDDIDHEVARKWFENNTEARFITDYIADETLTLLRSRGQERKAIELGEIFFESGSVCVYFLGEDDIRNVWSVFRKFVDKGWSFTDCSSKYICEKLGIKTAVSFDKHFHQFGSITVIP